MVDCILESPEATQELGRRIAGLAEAGTVVSLNGPLGAGKTCLPKGWAGVLGSCPITPPTFILWLCTPMLGCRFFMRIITAWGTSRSW